MCTSLLHKIRILSFYREAESTARVGDTENKTGNALSGISGLVFSSSSTVEILDTILILNAKLDTWSLKLLIETQGLYLFLA